MTIDFCMVCGTPIVMAQRVEKGPMAQVQEREEETQMLMPEAQCEEPRQLEQNVSVEQNAAAVQNTAEVQSAASGQWEQNRTVEPWVQQGVEMSAEENTMRVCANCRAYVEPDMSFCTECGQRLN